jgi:hypothetical protein
METTGILSAKNRGQSGIVAHTYNPSIQDIEAGG